MHDAIFQTKGGENRDRPAVSVRAATPADDDALREMYTRLSPRTIHLRFHAPFPEVPEWLLEHVVTAGRRNGGSLVAVVDGRIVGHAIYVRSENRREAETAIVVEDRWQSRGIGKLLLSRRADAARREGVEVFTSEVLGENRRIRELTASLFPGTRFRIEGGVYTVRTPLRASEPATAGSTERDAA